MYFKFLSDGAEPKRRRARGNLLLYPRLHGHALTSHFVQTHKIYFRLKQGFSKNLLQGTVKARLNTQQQIDASLVEQLTTSITIISIIIIIFWARKAATLSAVTDREAVFTPAYLSADPTF